ncbi:MAG: AMP-binding protein [Betaproteobacteria bacterium]|jgi:crotonobetaine/carnitine-CoA ligase|nr:AMP-binding protein [Betaproteobacteria bacterium]
MSATREPIEVISSYPAHIGTLSSMLASRATAAPDREFIVFQGESRSYLDVAHDVERAAALFAARGVQPGDRVGLMSLNHPSTVITFFALARLGAVMVPVNPEYGVEEAGYVLAHAQVCGVLCSPAALDRVRAARARIIPAPWLMLNAPGDSKLTDFANAMKDAPREAPADSATPDSTCVFIYTSGTTGFPKGVMHSQRNVLLAGEGFVERMHLQPDDRLLCILPMFHINALFYSLAGTLAAGATIVLVPKFSASSFWRTVADTRATEVNTIAAVTSILTQRPRSEFVAGHGLRKVYGAPFTAETYRIFRDEFHVPHLVEGYGMSEIPGVLNNPFEGPHKIGSMGRPSRHPDSRVAFAEMKVVDEAGGDLPDGETGELAVRTPIVMKGYYRDPEQTDAAFRDGWFLTGDLGCRDADGYFWFVARKKDIIRKRGENISGAELDRVIGAHPDVAEAAAIPVPDELGEDEILVAVVPKPGATPTARAIADWCSERLAAIKVPRYVAFVDALPHTPTHRVAKFKLRADAKLRDNAVDLKEETRG